MLRARRGSIGPRNEQPESRAPRLSEARRYRIRHVDERQACVARRVDPVAPEWTIAPMWRARRLVAEGSLGRKTLATLAALDADLAPPAACELLTLPLRLSLGTVALVATRNAVPDVGWTVPLRSRSWGIVCCWPRVWQEFQRNALVGEHKCLPPPPFFAAAGVSGVGSHPDWETPESVRPGVVLDAVPVREGGPEDQAFTRRTRWQERHDRLLA